MRQNIQWDIPVAMCMPSGQILVSKQHCAFKGTRVSWCLRHVQDLVRKLQVHSDKNGVIPESKNIVRKKKKTNSVVSKG